ncbi:adenylyl-sulfate kinase [Chryseotalea sanaruensis]|uniref:Adenylyl-sulfate kinase n=1 Tax=Chryseotalea sanaruensis TaxID=2482724 RepID=A0A401U6V9_9BACT|nr:adenylyl-sulfate kinase [Chryseotalea sanaruensis]GCC50625.1 adenylyl-sulfate kinase [Chryseotalea sanaruensis]
MNNLFPFQTKVSLAERELMLKQKPKLIWLTGLSGSGKSTISVQLEYQLHAMGFKTYLLDGDNIRTGLNKDLNFSNEGRSENIRRIAEVSKLMMDAGIVVIAAFISPFKADRNRVKHIVGQSNYIEVFVNCPVEVCEQRDVKGLYKKARAGEIKDFTGISSPYEIPQNPDIRIESDIQSLEESLHLLLDLIVPKISFT